MLCKRFIKQLFIERLQLIHKALQLLDKHL